MGSVVVGSPFACCARLSVRCDLVRRVACACDASRCLSGCVRDACSSWHRDYRSLLQTDLQAAAACEAIFSKGDVSEPEYGYGVLAFLQALLSKGDVSELVRGSGSLELVMPFFSMGDASEPVLASGFVGLVLASMTAASAAAYNFEGGARTRRSFGECRFCWT